MNKVFLKLQLSGSIDGIALPAAPTFSIPLPPGSDANPEVMAAANVMSQWLDGKRVDESFPIHIHVFGIPINANAAVDLLVHSQVVTESAPTV